MLCFTSPDLILPLCVAFRDCTRRSGKGARKTPAKGKGGGRGRKTTERKTIDDAKTQGQPWCEQKIIDLNNEIKEKQQAEDYAACGKLKQERDWVAVAIKELEEEAKAATAEQDEDDEDEDEDDGDAGDSRGVKRLRVGEYMCYHEPQEQGPPKYWSEYVGAEVKKEEEDDSSSDSGSD